MFKENGEGPLPFPNVINLMIIFVNIQECPQNCIKSYTNRYMFMVDLWKMKIISYMTYNNIVRHCTLFGHVNKSKEKS